MNAACRNIPSKHLPLTEIPTPPLAGLRVLDFTRILAGPYCTLLLAELGADVVKVEKPHTGDDTRAWGPPFMDSGETTSAYFAALNRGKRSVAVDFANPSGQELIARLAESCDVVIENFRPGVAERYGIDYDSLSARNPRIVTCSISGFGREGPYAGLPGTEIVVEAMSGLMSVTGPADGDPARFGVAMTDITTGLTAATRVMAAVMRARETGRGGHVEVSLYATAVGTLGTLVASASLAGEEPKRWGSHHPSIVPYGGFPTLDGDVITGVVNDGMWQQFCRVVGCPELFEDATLSTNAGRVRDRRRVESAVAAATSRRSSAELMADLTRNGLLAAPIRTVTQMLDDPATVELDLVSPVAGVPGMYTSRVSGDPNGVHNQLVPQLGQHTSSVLREVAGLSQTEIEQLSAAGVISSLGDQNA
jgi:crotonobetainyl-CoA:carnitine CoA-transferase CaiB-like acyl-CoA transferase